MKATVRRNVGVPVCVGIAATKTLAKLANKWAKNNPAFAGVCHWDSVPTTDRERLMGRLSVIEIWGVATRLTKRLNVLGIHLTLALNLHTTLHERNPTMEWLFWFILLAVAGVLIIGFITLIALLIVRAVRRPAAPTPPIIQPPSP
jgi:hypothetical protein